VALWQMLTGGQRRLARGPAGRGLEQLLDASVTIDSLLSGGDPDGLGAVLGGPAAGSVPPDSSVIVPIGGQEVWAAGVTYTRSLDARVLESGTPDIYQRVYQAERPELLLKAAPGRVRGPGEQVGIRADSQWDVPEPELAIVADRRGRIVGYMNGNDMSSRSIEGENPLYLPQAKVYTGSCAVGPCLVTPDDVPDLSELQISLRVVRDAADVYSDTVSVAGPTTLCAGCSGPWTSRSAWCCSPGRQTSRTRDSLCAGATR
jgi:2-dehydro-3-deoxy-D-arabinonate dehydratase